MADKPKSNALVFRQIRMVRACPNAIFAAMTITEQLVDLLELEQLEQNLYRGRSRDIGTPNVFGGQVLAQALRAATNTVPDPNRAESRGEVFKTNGALRDWAFELTKDVDLGDSQELAESRSAYTDHPNARRPPFVTTGGHIAAMTFWHGAMMNDWANRWVNYWSDGNTDFVTSAMEETGTYRAITYLHNIGRVDKDRFMVLRAGSNYTMPPPGVGAAENLLRENDGYAGLDAAVETLYRVGSKVVEELLDNWDTYQTTIPAHQP